MGKIEVFYFSLKTISGDVNAASTRIKKIKISDSVDDLQSKQAKKNFLKFFLLKHIRNGILI